MFAGCIRRALKGSSRCPYCRYQMPRGEAWDNDPSDHSDYLGVPALVESSSEEEDDYDYVRYAVAQHNMARVDSRGNQLPLGFDDSQLPLGFNDMPALVDASSDEGAST